MSSYEFTGGYPGKLERELRELDESIIMTLPEDLDLGSEGGRIKQFDGTLYFLDKGGCVFGKVIDYDKTLPYVIARIHLRNESSTKPYITIEKCFLFPDASAIVPLGEGRAQVIDVLAKYKS
ncbi:hypothetical protein KY334_07515 [Candidatus Woesearchaeota archaeon]|nr:hypothetical protein [Candidatus Woesearchaeota archaeon]